jgi:hypothetical protein
MDSRLRGNDVEAWAKEWFLSAKGLALKNVVIPAQAGIHAFGERFV